MAAVALEVEHAYEEAYASTQTNMNAYWTNRKQGPEIYPTTVHAIGDGRSHFHKMVVYSNPYTL